MTLIKPEELEKYLKAEINDLNNSDDAIEHFFNFYRNFKTKSKLDHNEEDMMLFQYQNLVTLEDGNEIRTHQDKLEFDLTRQFEIPDNDELLQLSFTLIFDLNS